MTFIYTNTFIIHTTTIKYLQKKREAVYFLKTILIYFCNKYIAN